MRTRVYVDGFNLYYQLKKSRTKWLNPVELARLVLKKHHKIDKLRYFTARVSGIPDQSAPARQQVYLNALGTLPEVEIHFGSFLSKTIWRPVINLPVAREPIEINASETVILPKGNHMVTGLGQTLRVGEYTTPSNRRKQRNSKKLLPDAIRVEVHTMEEKGSDVSLGCHLLNDAWKGTFDVAAIISNDADLSPPIEIVTKELNKPVVVICPKSSGATQKLRDVASSVLYVHPRIFKSAQFPASIPNSSITKPPGW